MNINNEEQQACTNVNTKKQPISTKTNDNQICSVIESVDVHNDNFESKNDDSLFHAKKQQSNKTDKLSMPTLSLSKETDEIMK